MPRLASISQPKGQELHCTQLPALREIGPPLAPIAARPLHRELAVAAHPLGVERRHPQELLGLGEVGARGRAPRRPRARLASPRGPASGARKQVPELITVVPPTVRATGTGIGGRPSAIVRPASR